MALQYLYAPSGYEPGKANGILPNIANADLGFVRGSSATRINGEGLIEDMGANVPRLDYTDGSCPTLLTEPERTNIAKYSENILSWSVNPSNWGGTRTSNALTSPDGSNSADLISVIQQSGGLYAVYECYRRNYLFFFCLRKANIGNINIEVCSYV